ncbi:uridylate-specific endoribonuclease C [Tachysurus ichikawai]
MKRAHQYLVQNGKSNSEIRQFKSQLYHMWFRLYHRDRTRGADSSGFEHVFVGETKSGTTRNDMPYADDQVLNVQFSWHGLLKPVGSTFIGVSPEFEMAVFTIFFLTSTEKTSTAVVNMDQYQLELVVNRRGRSISTFYPKLLSNNNRHILSN